MSKLSSVLKKTGIAVAAAAMLVTMGAGTVVTQAKTSLPVYKVSLAKKYTDRSSAPVIRLIFPPFPAASHPS